jgi:hypothetical protein
LRESLDAGQEVLELGRSEGDGTRGRLGFLVGAWLEAGSLVAFGGGVGAALLAVGSWGIAAATHDGSSLGLGGSCDTAIAEDAKAVVAALRSGDDSVIL